MRRSASIAATLLFVFASSCCSTASAAAPTAGNDAGTPAKFPPDQIEYFEKHVRPILVKRCVECHGSELQEAGLRLDSRKALLFGIEGHPVAIPGDPGKSQIISVVKYDGKVQMPPDGKIPEDELAKLTTWVSMGLPWPVESTAAVTMAAPSAPPADTLWSGTMDERYRKAREKHWALQPVVRVQPPQTSIPEWNRSPVDRFVFAKLAEKGLHPSPPADKRTLLRRAYYDLIGLPPTADEVEAFERDASPDAFAKVVDKLLASPQYGERWARHWLDLARYADTKGYVFTAEKRFPFAYTYRDYVISAFNEDKPYDQFLLEQFAADLLPTTKTDRESLAALGFLTLTRFANPGPDRIDDQMDVAFRTTMGLTVGCARCHDHKFDPIATKDYYALYGVFNSVQTPAELPLLAEPRNSPEYEQFKKEMTDLVGKQNAYVAEMQAKLTDETRRRTSEYLAKIVEERSSQLQGRAAKQALGDLRANVFGDWKNYLSRSRNQPGGVFGAWHRYSAINDAEFGKQVAAVTDELLKSQSDPKKPLVNAAVRKAIEARPPKSMKDVATIYGELFTKADAEWRGRQNSKTRKPAEAATTKLADPALEELRQILYAADSPATLTADETRAAFDRKEKDKYDKIQKDIDRLVVTSPGSPPRAMVVEDTATPRPTTIFVRGNPANRGPLAPRQFLPVLATSTPKPYSDKSSGRLEMAKEIVDTANPLTARVMVNRIWMLHFGRGLVDSPSDFGVRTEKPTHPELLDYLAASFVEEGWSVKRLHRALMLTQTYQQASASPTTTPKTGSNPLMVDPENRLLWRMNRRRLEFEPMRDSLLAVAGSLDLKPFGRPVDLWKAPYPTRRTIYGFIDRQDLPGVFGVFDFANPDVTIEQRSRTTVPQQALFAMNSPFVQEQARKVVSRPEVAEKSDGVAKAEAIYRAVLGRRATPGEAAALSKFAGDVSSIKPVVPTWQYGYGTLDVNAGRVEAFHHFKHWTGQVWQEGPKFPDAKLGHAILRQTSGHAGRGLDQTTIIRWTAPVDGIVALNGRLKHGTKEGDGVICHAVSSRSGKLGAWKAYDGSVNTAVAEIEIRAGDTIDLVIEPGKSGSHDSFEYLPEFRLRDSAAPKVWDYAKDFHGPPAAKMNAWELAAHALLMSNEFMFVD